MNKQVIACDFALPGAFELLCLLRPVLSDEQAAANFGAVHMYLKTIIAEAITAHEREHHRRHAWVSTVGGAL